MPSYYKPGRYLAKITDVSVSKSKGKGTPQVVVQIVPLAVFGKDDKLIELPQRYTRSMYWALTKDASDWTIDRLRQIGFEGTSLNDLFDERQRELIIGREIDVTFDVRSHEGRNFDQWDLYREDFAGAPLDETEMRELNALFGKKLKETAPKKSRSTKASQKPKPLPEPEPASVTQEYSDDDIPF